MERNVPEYSQSDHASAAQYPSTQEPRGNSYPTSATPTSEYGNYPQSARSTSSFPEHSLRPYHPANNHSGSGDPSIAAPSPTYATTQYSPYAAPPAQDMSHSYPQSGSLYAQPRPDWGNYGHPAPSNMGQHPVYHPQPPTAPGRPPQYGGQQVYSFVPIPGAQQHKRPRRRYEEIERMYKCGWNGCEKAYGTLNHLNAHVTMQSHGQKRTPEEFKEIRKEWKARKKEEEQSRKAAEEAERQRHVAAAQAVAQNGGPDPQGGDPGGASSSYPASGRLPPIAYESNQYPAPPSATVPQQPLPQYSPNNHIYPGYQQPASPYAPQSQQMYSQRE
ncbi:hypothetical protein F4820DRAFT_147552 [Hypoxylon rubiginosum]|uniref:Uncharacterized protein n=1 Tax=Hypoxylon rubiginosum TaxID=110542 RepID=A0ACB9ZGT4_9PEZI|nr:hypothetical protein F4820DRAFT_147552 [Hypoxylon rubiginosum]